MSDSKIDLRTSEGRRQQAIDAANEAIAPIADKVNALLNLLSQQGGLNVGNKPEDAPEPTLTPPKREAEVTMPKVSRQYKATKAKAATPKLPAQKDITPVEYFFDDAGRFHAVYDTRANGMNHTKNGNPCIASHQRGLIPFTLPWDDSKVLLFAQGTVMIGDSR